MSDPRGRIVVSGLTKTFGAVQAVELSFTVEPGSVTCSLGPNGTGKTTAALRMLLELVTPDAGGWAATNIAITLDTYSHVLPRMDEAAATFGAMLRDAAAEG